MQGSKLEGLFFQSFQNFGSYERGLFKVFAAGNYSVADCVDFFHRFYYADFFVHKSVENEPNGFFMVRHALLINFFAAVAFCF